MSDKLDIIHDVVVRIEKKVDNHAERITKIETSYFNDGNGIKSKVECNEQRLQKIELAHSDCFGKKWTFKAAWESMNKVSTGILTFVIICAVVVLKYTK